ncbi:hypothetical protein PR002_g19918 [Phytophthora rubi]|uniref:Uncharacterized protein n=1 Tax=Phytophthora rubi TaxID=129364 RepID=A0A6A3JH67_9STRA|nr:hypothetical protein PR002_g19918 [Phytophthora rubi]
MPHLLRATPCVGTFARRQLLSPFAALGTPHCHAFVTRPRLPFRSHTWTTTWSTI